MYCNWSHHLNNIFTFSIQNLIYINKIRIYYSKNQNKIEAVQ
jgi:hypothetical protein